VTDKRRRIAIRVTGIAAVACAWPVLPRQWQQPLIESVVLPAHAQTSNPPVPPLRGGLFALDVGPRTDSGGSPEPAIISITVRVCTGIESDVDVSAVATLSPAGSINLAAVTIPTAGVATTTVIAIEAPIFAPVANIMALTLTFSDGSTTQVESITGTDLTSVLTGSERAFVCLVE